MKSAVLQRSLTGLLIVDKPSGPTSNRVLQRVRQLFNFKKVGHTGCLDPLASGVLPICFGGATRLAEFMLADNKVYEADIRLGITTTTGDAGGDILTENPIPEYINDTYLIDLLASFIGTSAQQAHKYSALKYQGKPLYAYAREGIEVPAKHREITISSIQWLQALPPTGFKIQISCSKGTYIRSLAEDIGNKIGCGAYLTGLKRIESGGFCIQQAWDLEQLESLSLPEREQQLLPAWQAVPHWKKISIEESLAEQLLVGQPVPLLPTNENVENPEKVVLLTQDQRFLGLGRVEEGKLFPWRMMAREKIFAHFN